MAWQRTAVVAALMVGTAMPAMAGSYKFVPIRFPGAAFTVPTGLSPANTVVGFFGDTKGAGHGFVWSAGKYTQVDAPGAYSGVEGPGTQLYGINGRGMAVGIYETENNQHVFTYDIKTGALTTTSFPGNPTASFGNPSINDSGAVTGPINTTVRGYGRSFLQRGTSVRIIVNPAGADGVVATGISDTGLVIGGYNTNQGRTSRSFTFKGGVASDFSVAGDPTGLTFVTPDGTFGGAYIDGKVVHGFVRKAQVVTTYDYPGAAVTEVNGMTAAGAVVGKQFYQDGSIPVSKIFLALAGTFYDIKVPLPNPGSYQAPIAVNPAGSFIGFSGPPGSSLYKYFVAVCTPDQIPCTQ